MAQFLPQYTVQHLSIDSIYPFSFSREMSKKVKEELTPAGHVAHDIGRNLIQTFRFSRAEKFNIVISGLAVMAGADRVTVSTVVCSG